MKKNIIISLVAASTLLLQGCNNTPSTASENKSSDPELQSIKNERDSLEKTNKELTKKIADLESKTNKEQKASPNTDKEKLKKQLTDKTFIAPKSNAEGRLSIAELEMSLKEYLMPKNAKHEDYELERNDGLPSDNKTVYALRKDNHIGNMAVVGYYALDGNGYIYKYDFVEQKVEDTPLTNIYIEGILPDNKDDSTIKNESQTFEEHKKEREENIKEDKKNSTYDNNDPLKYQ
ncbi:hypothetical protein [Bacillus cereus]|uniref:hypothetical protein n=1 Tax=Bacillus cereus TaxID=1396 RepID=UPI000975D21E|nr:hypothetical protein [Bacillus cereus]ONH02268.1 hypothetical protein BKK45_01595 [Bacillus cereus]